MVATMAVACTQETQIGGGVSEKFNVVNPEANAQPVPGFDTIVSVVPTPETSVVIQVPLVVEPEIRLATPAETTTTVAEIPAAPVFKEGVYCGPSRESVMQNPAEVLRIIKAANITEVHPPCTSAYGREGIGEGLTEVAPGISLTQANQTMLQFARDNGFKYFVDEPRFLSADPALQQAAYNDYKDWIVGGGTSFGIELPDEAQPEALDALTPSLEGLRDLFTARGVDITEHIRPNFAVLDTTPEVIRTMVNIFGPNLKAGVDTYTTDQATWDNVAAMMNQPGYEISDWMIAFRGANWQRPSTGFKNEPADPQEVAAYLSIGIGLEGKGVKGWYDFTGFPANENIFGEQFDGNLTQPDNLDTLLQARQIAGVGSNNKFDLTP